MGMQSTYCISFETLFILQSIIGKGKMELAHGTNGARGVAILFNPELNVKIVKTSVCNEGRYFMVNNVINKEKNLLIYVYAPMVNLDETL